MRNIVWILAASALALAGCATAPISVNYAPSSTLTVKGTEKIGGFDYTPTKSGKIKSNQIRNTAIGSILIDKDVSQFFQQAFFTESRFVGIDVSGAGPLVHGTINDFLADDLGYSVDWTLDVNYVVDSPNNESPCFNSSKKTKRNTSKFVNVFGALNEVVKENIEDLLKDPGFVACIAPK